MSSPASGAPDRAVPGEPEFPEPPQALLFDVFGTVVDWRASLIDHFFAFGAVSGRSADWVALVDGWRAAYRPGMDGVLAGHRPWAKLDDLHRESLDRLLAIHGLDDLDAAMRDQMVRFWHDLRPWPDSVAALTRLKARFVIAPLSNGNLALLTRMAKRAGLPWDAILSAELYRSYKPDPATYLGACDLLSLRPDQVMMVAAHNDDLVAARACGLQTGFVVRPREYGPDQRKDLTPTEAWEVTGADLGAIADKLGA